MQDRKHTTIRSSKVSRRGGQNTTRHYAEPQIPHKHTRTQASDGQDQLTCLCVNRFPRATHELFICEAVRRAEMRRLRQAKASGLEHSQIALEGIMPAGSIMSFIYYSHQENIVRLQQYCNSIRNSESWLMSMKLSWADYLM